MALVITGATVIDGVTDEPIEGRSIWIEGNRIKAVGRREDFRAPVAARVVDARGKYVVPGLMNANVHLLCDIRLENLVRHLGRFEDLIAEAAQVALRNGLTTVFDTWGPRQALITVRDRINVGEIPGSRFFCAGNIVGFDGPFSADFMAEVPKVASAALVRRINSTWVENVGRHLMWLTPEEVAREVREYIGKGIDFIKYASNEHCGADAGAFLAFSPAVQAAIVEEAHRAGRSAQAHTMTVEGLRIAIEAGCDLIQHANITGPAPIPEGTLELMSQRRTGMVVFPFTGRGLDWIMGNVSEVQRTMWHASDANARALIGSDATLLLGTDGALFSPEIGTDPALGKSSGRMPQEENLFSLATGHFAWFRAMEEKRCPPMRMLKAATRNIAMAFGKDRDLGTLEADKVADMLILDANPLEAAANYCRIHMVVKDGAIVDRDALPVTPILTAPMAAPAEEETAYVPFFATGKLPACPACMWR
jgi:imidazolonepropionase-like amidohydrolase